MMDCTTAMLILAGVCGGIVNAVAGGATLLTFPVLLATGLPPVAANIANAIAVSPGHLLAVLADRQSLPDISRHLLLLLFLSAIGGLAGAGLLLIMPAELFTLPIPALIGGATLLFALAPRIASEGGKSDALNRIDHLGHMSTRQYTRLIDERVSTAGSDKREYGTHSLRRTTAPLIYKAAGNLRAVQILQGHMNIENTVRYLGIRYRRRIDLV